jgi:hypothetical protein
MKVICPKLTGWFPSKSLDVHETQTGLPLCPALVLQVRRKILVDCRENYSMASNIYQRGVTLPMVAQVFEIRVEASTNIDWKSRFEEVYVTLVGDEEVVLRGVVQDEPALHGLLGRIRAAGLVLKSVELMPKS